MEPSTTAEMCSVDVYRLLVVRRTCGVCQTPVSAFAWACPTCGKRLVDATPRGVALVVLSAGFAVVGLLVLYSAMHLPLDAAEGDVGWRILAAVIAFGLASGVAWIYQKDRRDPW